VRVARKLSEMLEEPKFAERAQSVSSELGLEDGVRAACDALEDLHVRMPGLG